MNTGRTVRSALLVLMLIVGSVLLLNGCSGDTDDSRNIVYEDMKNAFDESGLLSANIGIFSRTEKDGSVTYGEGGSGIIFKKDGGTRLNAEETELKILIG